MDHRRQLRGDCSACQGLCCVSLAFDRSEWFAFDKPAETPCRHLTPNHACGIHARRVAEGQAGCAGYDCYGAGQRVCQALFVGASWRDDPEQARAMFSSFRRLKQINELRFLLHEASALPLSRLHAVERARLLGALEPEPDFDRASLEALDLCALELDTHRLLRSLRVYFTDRAARLRLRVLSQA